MSNLIDFDVFSTKQSNYFPIEEISPSNPFFPTPFPPKAHPSPDSIYKKPPFKDQIHLSFYQQSPIEGDSQNIDPLTIRAPQTTYQNKGLGDSNPLTYRVPSISTYEFNSIEFSKPFPLLMDTLRRELNEEIKKEVGFNQITEALEYTSSKDLISFSVSPLTTNIYNRSKTVETEGEKEEKRRPSKTMETEIFYEEETWDRPLETLETDKESIKSTLNSMEPRISAKGIVEKSIIPIKNTLKPYNITFEKLEIDINDEDTDTFSNLYHKPFEKSPQSLSPRFNTSQSQFIPLKPGKEYEEIEQIMREYKEYNLEKNSPLKIRKKKEKQFSFAETYIMNNNNNINNENSDIENYEIKDITHNTNNYMINTQINSNSIRKCYSTLKNENNNRKKTNSCYENEESNQSYQNNPSFQNVYENILKRIFNEKPTKMEFSKKTVSSTKKTPQKPVKSEKKLNGREVNSYITKIMTEAHKYKENKENSRFLNIQHQPQNKKNSQNTIIITNNHTCCQNNKKSQVFQLELGSNPVLIPLCENPNLNLNPTRNPNQKRKTNQNRRMSYF